MAADEAGSTSKKKVGVDAWRAAGQPAQGWPQGRFASRRRSTRCGSLLHQISDAAAKEEIVKKGVIKPLIATLTGGRLSAVAQEHAATRVSGLAPIGENAYARKVANGIDPLVSLLSAGNAEAKKPRGEHARAARAARGRPPEHCQGGRRLRVRQVARRPDARAAGGRRASAL